MANKLPIITLSCDAYGWRARHNPQNAVIGSFDLTESQIEFMNHLKKEGDAATK